MWCVMLCDVISFLTTKSSLIFTNIHEPEENKYGYSGDYRDTSQMEIFFVAGRRFHMAKAARTDNKLFISRRSTRV